MATITTSLDDLAKTPNLLQIEIQSINLYKFTKTEWISLAPQFVELSIFQSIHQPIMKAELVINDTIGLHVNFPIVGEETIEITYIPTRQDPSSPFFIDTELRPYINTPRTLKFMVSKVRSIHPDDKARSTFYILDLYSTEFFHDARLRVQKAYNQGYELIVQDILKTFLQTDTTKINTFNFEASKSPGTLIIPNMRPLEAISWCARRAVPTNNKHNLYFFYENFFGFNFKTVQLMIEQTSRDKYIYFANVVPGIRSLPEYPQIEQHTITAIEINNRYSTIEKIIGGFYDNEFVVVDVNNRTITSKRTQANTTPQGTMSPNQLNTPMFMYNALVQDSTVGAATRVRYVTARAGGDDPTTLNSFSEKFGPSVQHYNALTQVSLTVSIPGNTNINVGDMIDIELPEMHGYNKVEEDAYISGRYLISSAKHVISAGMNHVMVLELHRDSYKNPIALVKKYGS